MMLQFGRLVVVQFPRIAQKSTPNAATTEIADDFYVKGHSQPPQRPLLSKHMEVLSSIEPLAQLWPVSFVPSVPETPINAPDRWVTVGTAKMR